MAYSQQRIKTVKKFNWGIYTDFTSHGALSNLRVDLAAAFGEFIGTFMFLTIGLGGIQASVTSTSSNSPSFLSGSLVPNVSQITYISASMALSLLFSAWIFFRATGAAFNPNVSFTLLLIGAISPTRFLLYVEAQFAASIGASYVLQALLPGTLAVTPRLGAGTTQAQGLFIEALATCALLLSVLFLAAEKHRATHLAPLGIALTLFACHMFAVVYTGASMNCARAFGPAVVTGFSEYHWIYWLGPTIGSLSAAAIYTFMKRFEYWKWNEGQDTDVFSSSPQLFVTVSAVEEEVTGDSITCPVQVVPNNRNPGIKV